MKLNIKDLLQASALPLLGGAAIFAAACGGGGGDDGGGSSDRLKIVASTTILADFVEVVAGERAEVVSLLPSGADPHTYELRPSQVALIAEADVIFVNGLGLEEAAMRVIENNIPSDALLVILAEALLDAGVEPLPHFNPHLWLDPTLAARYVQHIAEQLAAVDPEKADTFTQATDAFQEELGQLDELVMDRIASIPPSNRMLVTTHDAFGYFTQRYPLEEFTVVPSPTQNPSPADMADLVSFLRSQAVPAVFTEPQVEAAGKLLQRAAEDAGIPVCTLYSDALNDDVPSYIDLMRFNADELARCLAE